MRKRIVLMLVSLSFLFAGSTIKKPAKQDVAVTREEKIVRYLGLSEQQENAIRELRLNFQREMMRLKSKARELQIQQKLEITAQNPDRNKLQRLVNEQVDLQKKIRMKSIDLQLSIRKLLSGEQLQKFDSWLLKMGNPRHSAGRFPRRYR